MPPMPSVYSSELVNLIRAMLNKTAEKRPSVSRVLRDPYIKRNIALFLEETRSRFCFVNVKLFWRDYEMLHFHLVTVFQLIARALLYNFFRLCFYKTEMTMPSVYSFKQN